MKTIWNRINGKKTLSGILVTIIGIIMFQIKFTVPAAPYVLSTGLGMLGIGGTHKYTKHKQFKKE